MNMQANVTRHVKVAFNGEFRRFTLQSLKFEELESTLRALFSLGAVSFKVKFQDDENDWVVISTDSELQYTTELTGNPLRLTIELNQSAEVPRKPEIAIPTSTDAQPVEVNELVDSGSFPHRGKWGRGGCGRGRGKFNPAVKERLQAKHSRLSGKIAEVEELLKTPELSSERERVLLWKLEKLKNKLAFVEKRRSAFDESNESPENLTSNAEEANALDEEGCWKRRGGRGRGRGGRGGRGRGGCRKMKWEENHEEATTMDPEAAREAVKRFRQMKTDLQFARKSGDVQAIATCELAFKQAKRAKKQGMTALLSDQRSHKRECLANLRKAKQAGNEAQIRECEEALAKAVIELKRVKAELLA